ncbi:hypothetical protein K474DRAFT_1583097, partial [Panus rudis PR-1116 ss-1]
LPVKYGTKLFQARVIPHLTYGAEVALDDRVSRTTAMAKVQHNFLRRLLGLNSHSMVAPLATETGFIDIRYQRAITALRYLLHLLRDAPCLPSVALRESTAMSRAGHHSWLLQLQNTLLAL